MWLLRRETEGINNYDNNNLHVIRATPCKISICPNRCSKPIAHFLPFTGGERIFVFTRGGDPPATLSKHKHCGGIYCVPFQGHDPSD